MTIIEALGEIEVQLKLLEARKSNLLKQALENLRDSAKAQSTQTGETKETSTKDPEENQFTGSAI